MEDGVRDVDISVKPVLRENDPAHGYFVVTFDDRGPADQPTDESVTLTSPAEPITRHLEDELARVKGQLRTTIEQYETQVEESKASNEELQAMNEELRSAAEELETSKEELQSVNEELTTVNQELKIKIEELGLTNNDFQNFINATDIGTIFLDRSFRVKFSTPHARQVFNLLDTDTGRPLSDITNRLRNEDIHDAARTVLERLVSIEREVQTTDGRWHAMRVLPYRTSDNHIDGVVLTFQEITEKREAEQRVRQSEERLRMLMDSALDYAIFTVSEEGVIDSWNSGAERMFGYVSDDVIGKTYDLLFTEEDRAAGVPQRELQQARELGRAADERYHVRRDGTRLFCSGVTRRLGTGGMGFAKIARDLTRERRAADALQRAHDNLESGVKARTVELESAVREQEVARQSATTLLHRLVNAQEDERRRIARDLHDHLGQQLTALRLALEHVAPKGTAHAGDIARAIELTQQIGRDVDMLAWELRPSSLDELGLAAALPRLVTQWAADVGIRAEFRLGTFQQGELSRDAELAFYRVAQEALNNVAKHAHASRVDVLLTSNDGQVVLVVEDDGVGFDPHAAGHSASGVGLASMRERATLAGAALQFESTPGKGTSVFLRRPIDGAARDQAP
jgi:PAS domain S-box-containing protein